MATPHDALFKAIFAAPHEAAGLIRPLLPAPLAAAIDWRSLGLVPGSFVDATLRQLHSDLLFDVRIHGRAALLYFLLEHKSRGDRFTAFYLLRCAVDIWSRWRARHPRARFLPPIVPVVVHHGSRPWQAPTSLHGLIDPCGLDAAAADSLIALQPAFTFTLDDLAHQDDADLRNRRVSALAQLALTSMRFLRGASANSGLATVARWLDVVARAMASPEGVERIPVLWSYILQVSDVVAEQLGALVGTVGPDAEETVMSTANRLRAEGKAEGKAELLLRQLEARFGPLSATVVERVHRAPPATLERWALAVLSARSLEDALDRA